MTGRFSDWTPYQNFVQSGLADGAFAHGGFTLIAAGPPRLQDIGGSVQLANALAGGGAAANDIVLPIGGLQNFSLGQNKNFARIYELGSYRSYFIAGRDFGQIGLGRVYYHGASLLRLLYAYYQDALVGGGVTIAQMYQSSAGQNQANPHDVIISPGYENIFLNLGSDLFSQPVGLLLYLRDSNNRTLGSGYFEHVVVPNHNLAVDSQGLLIQEQCGLQYERLVPVKVTDVNLVTNDSRYSNGSRGAAASSPVLAV